MYQFDENSSLWRWLQNKGPAVGYYLFDFRFAEGDLPVRRLCTKQGTIRVGDRLYLPFRTQVALDPPTPTAYSVDQNIFSLSLAPRTAEEMEFEMQLWTGRIYPQPFTLQRPDLPGISAVVHAVGKTGTATGLLAGEVWFRDTAVRFPGVGDGADLVRCWVNQPQANPPEVSIAPEALPDGIWTATPGSNAEASGNVYFQYMRLEGGTNIVNMAFGTEFFYQDPADPDNAVASLRLWDAAHQGANPTRATRWLTADAERRYSLRITNRRTQGSRDIPFSSMRRLTTGGLNYSVEDADLRSFMRDLPNYRDSSLPESFREYGARMGIVANETVTLSTTAPVQLYSGKLHSVAKPKYEDSGYRLDLGFSGPLSKIDAVKARRLTPAEQKAIDPTDRSMESLTNVQVFGWGQETQRS